MWNILQWLATAVSILGLYWTGKHRTGFLVSNIANIMWTAYEWQRHIWGGVVLGIIFLPIYIRNYRVSEKEAK